MNTLRFVKYIYIGITVLSLLSLGCTTLSVINILPGLLILWFIYLFFMLGYNSIRGSKGMITSCDGYMPIKIRKLLFAIIALICTYAIARFYTGQTPASVISNIINDNSLYLSYQRYHASHHIGTFSLSKLPYIFANFILNFLATYSYLYYLICKQPKLKANQIFYLIVVGASFLYFGIARGTGFELFEFAFLLVYALLCGKIRLPKSHKSIGFKKKIIIVLICSVAVAGFIFVTGRRMNITTSYQVSREFGYDRGKLISYIFPQLGLLITRLDQYFVWGIYMISVFTDKVILGSVSKLFLCILPYGLKIAGINSTYGEIQHYIDTSTNWNPDFLGYLSVFGLIGWAVLIFLFGKLIRKHENRTDIISAMIVYYCAFEMFSLPLGNFIVVSSANKLVCVTLVLVQLIRKLCHGKTLRTEEPCKLKQNQL